MEEERYTLLDNRPSQKPWGLHFRSSRGFILLTVVVSIFTDDVLYGIIVPVLPNTIGKQFNLSHDEVQAWISIFLAVFGATGLVTARYITDRTGSRSTVFTSGLIGITAATFLLYIGSSLAMLTIARALQGMATAIVHTVGIALVVDKSPPEKLGRTLGIVGAGMTAAVIVGPLLGGAIYRFAGYQAVFYVSFALLIVDLVLRFMMIENPPAIEGNASNNTNSSRDELVTSPMGQGNGGYGTIQSDASHRHSGHLNGEFPVNDQSSPQHQLVKPASFEGRDTRWYIPSGVYLLGSPRVVTCLFLAVLNAAMLTCFDSTLPIFTRDLFGWDALFQGLIFLTIAIPSLFAPVTGHLTDKVGVRLPILTGFILATAAFILLSFIDGHADTLHQGLLVGFLVLVGIGLTLIHPATMAEINHAVREEAEAHPERFGKGATGQANALRNCAFSAGITFGPLVAGFVKESFGWATMTRAFAVAGAVACVSTVLWAGGWILKSKEEEEGGGGWSEDEQG
ncbi:MFS general substrate transporter [Cryphonectria parasitica EP155]|uniref:MFS general substrate transporter n=1 Tax=Cryphonectria parasitica (strain ATCC 38755 / EP155) TaxID=660469 RepID=A0A9P4XU68_CRYP1|nr:MFS general substrate transporter [Cryphonectria parasitica EP155]KAF3761347.1 MFS general substrate transporter [Cryphonectria parasitica EP155]